MGMSQPEIPDVSFEDSQFGIFHLDRLVNWFEGETNWGSQPVRLCLSVEDDLDFKGALKVAQTLWNTQADWNQKVYDCGITKLLAVKNDFWLQNGEEKITAEEFRIRMTLESITVSPYGGIEFWFDDGDLFWGHTIMIEGSISEGPTDARFEG